MRKIVLENEASFTPLLVERKAGETQLFVKQVKFEGKRYIVCRNEAEAEKDRKDREAIVAALDAQLKKGDKALVGNSAYRRYLRKIGKAKDNRSFEIDAGKLAEEARFDGIFVLRTNAKVTPLQAVLRIAICCRSKISSCAPRRSCARGQSSIRPTPPSVAMCFVPFLALAMQKHLDDLLREAGATPEWKELLRDLDRLQNVRLEHRGADWLVRTDATPNVAALFRHAHIALPPRAKQTARPKAASSTSGRQTPRSPKA